MDPTLQWFTALVKDFGPWTFTAFLFYLWRQAKLETDKKQERIDKLEDSRLQLATSTAVLAERLADAVDVLRERRP